MIVHQFLDDFYTKDAIGNYILIIDRLLKDRSIGSYIFAKHRDNLLMNKSLQYDKYPEYSSSEDIILFHFSIYSNILSYVSKIKRKKILVFHNITPPEFFEDGRLKTLLKRAREQLYLTNTIFDKSICDSSYNAYVLRQFGFEKKIDIIPPIVSRKERFITVQKSSSKNKRKKEVVNIIHVSQFLKHKRIDDVIKVFTTYQSLYNQCSNLILIGGYHYSSEYYRYIQSIAAKSKNIIFAGKVSDQRLAEYYENADLMISLSEHEGFGVPFIEAMNYRVPIIAYDAGATKETVGEGGIIIKTKDYLLISAIIHRLAKDRELRQEIIKRQKKELKKYDYKLIEKKLLRCLKKN